uniref:Cyclin-like domain-containing protein n=1 Tax=Corethron hystrix TaxID=216773 RepID=A0A7S1BSR7_9STRA|mmetsp:Transcript_38121/g.88732  ORF Transcript_38121/g.88732 Transcript_38121/m.88732 type:complete len:318 (+) Transcript_38121:43-996(+)
MSASNTPPRSSSSRASASPMGAIFRDESSWVIPPPFDPSLLPSRFDGMSWEEEKVHRKKTCRFLEEAGRKLRLPKVAIATSEVFFHRFFSKQSLEKHDRFEIAVACLFLAAKTEESPRKLHMVLECFHRLKNESLMARQGQRNADGSAPAPPRLDPRSSEGIRLKERILLLERLVLHTISFDLSVEHPFRNAVDIIQKTHAHEGLEHDPAAGEVRGASATPSNPLQELLQGTVAFVNDSLQTCVCIQFPPAEIAAGCVFMAARVTGIRTKSRKDWAEVLPVGLEALVCEYRPVKDACTKRRSCAPILSFSLHTLRQP